MRDIVALSMIILHAILLGIIEGITEFLPISSTGHLILGSEILGIAQTDFVTTFQIVIQVGAMLAVMVLYAKRIMNSASLWRKVLAGFIPTAIIGYALYALIKQFLLGNSSVVAWSLIIGGIIIILFEKWYGTKRRFGKDIEDISYREAIIIGLFQALAVIPGVSRSGATIIGGLVQNISREAIVEFSFLLAVPVICAAALLDIIKTPLVFTGYEWGILGVGTIVAFITAIFAITFFITYIKKHSFTVFGYYRIVIGVVTLGFIYFF